ncbi:MAG: efflux RND transporter permease subunit [Kiritimatiellia bacterium]
MSFSQIFIDRPRVAFVLSILLAFCGWLCLRTIPVAEYPEIAPTTIYVTASYPGASSEVIAETVAIPIEDQINAVDDLIYYSSSCNNNGSYACYVTFRSGTDSNMNLVNLQNAVKRAEPKLPSEVLAKGLTVNKRQEDRMAMYVFLTDGRQVSIMDLCNFVENEVKDAVQRLPGVSLVEVSNRKYAMRVWLNPVRMTGMGVSIFDVKTAIQSQNVQAAAGTIGSEYSNRYLSYKLNVKGRLKTKEEFENIVVRSNPDTGAQVLLKDVARVELGAKTYSSTNKFNDDMAIFMHVYKAPEANAIATVDSVKAEVEKWIGRLPSGVRCVLADDSTAFTKVFMKETAKTLVEALLLVVLITYLFLQDWRATFVPAIAIPISLLGAFLFLRAMGFTLNILTMFGLILVIGSLVDDAIVVVENTQALMAREGLSARAAAGKSMRQITGAIVATTLVTLSCYLPLAFYRGMVGKMYVQFAVTMCIALCLSTLVALTLSPVLCSLLLKKPADRAPAVFRPVNGAIEFCRRSYLLFVRFFVDHGVLALLLFGAVAAAMCWLRGRVPEALLPKEDRGYIRANIELAEGASLQRTIEVVEQFNERIRGIPGVDSVSSSTGSSPVNGTGENYGGSLIRLKHWDLRKSPELSIESIMGEIEKRTADIYAAKISLFTPPPIRGLGSLGGIGFWVCSVGDFTSQQLAATMDTIQQTMKSELKTERCAVGFNANTPQLYLDLDRKKAESLGVTAQTVFSTLQNKLASFYVNDFNMKGGSYEVIIQSQADYRSTVNEVMEIRFPGSNGAMVPLSAIGKIRYSVGPREIKRFNKMQGAWINIQTPPGMTNLEVLNFAESMKLPPECHLEYNGMALQEKENQGQIVWLMGLAVFFAYLFLVAQYESWSIPVSVMLSVVFAVCGGLLGLFLTDTEMSVYAQLGLVMLIGLAAKNAILMVEFSKQERARGVPVREAAINGASLRYRAVMMTAWSFLFGVFPLVRASGAGAGAQKAIGITTFSGMLMATLVGIVFVPALYSVFQRIRERLRGEAEAPRR